MIQAESMLKVADNTGAKKIACIKVLSGSRRRYARLGDIIVASVKEAVPSGQLKKKTVVRAVIVRQVKNYGRADGTYIKLDDNAAVILDKEGNMQGTRIFGPIAKELRDRGYKKIASLAPEVL